MNCNNSPRQKLKSFFSAMSDFAKDINVSGKIRQLGLFDYGTFDRKSYRGLLLMTVVFVPSEDIRRKFEDYIWSITHLTKNLALYNHTLLEARDRLLPKLMSGEINLISE